MAIYSQLSKCRGCGSRNLDMFWSGGNQFIVGFPDKDNTVPLSQRAPLDLGVCTDCWLVQLLITIEPDRLYRNFWYRSSTNEMMRQALGDVVRSACERVTLQDGDTVVDIGCNDGYLFDTYPKDKVLLKLGFDPARNIQSPGKQNTWGGWEFCSDYFSRVVYRELLGVTGSAKIVTACAMFYDLDDPKAFAEDVASILHPDGVFVIQMNYLPAMMQNCNIDNISHEHLCYYSLSSLVPILHAAGLRAFDAETNDVNGGSIRVYVCKAHTQARRQVTDQYLEILAKEKLLLLDTVQPYSDFVKKISHRLSMIDSMLLDLKKRGEVIYVYGASTRGTVLLQLLMNTHVLKGAAERDMMKWGKMMVGSWVPIVSEKEARSRATVFLVLPYHFLPSIIQREKEWIQGGGKLLVPLPEARLLSTTDVYKEWMDAEKVRSA